MSQSVRYDEDSGLYLYDYDNAMPWGLGRGTFLTGMTSIYAFPWYTTMPYDIWYENGQIAFDPHETDWADIQTSPGYLYNMLGKCAVFTYEVMAGETPDFLNRTYDYDGINDFIDVIKPIVPTSELFSFRAYIIVYGNGHSQDFTQYPYCNAFPARTNGGDGLVPEKYFLGLGTFVVMSEHSGYGPYHTPYIENYPYGSIGYTGGARVEEIYDTDIPLFRDFEQMCLWLWEDDEMGNFDRITDNEGIVNKGVFMVDEISDSNLLALRAYMAFGSITGNIAESIISLKLIRHPATGSLSDQRDNIATDSSLGARISLGMIRNIASITDPGSFQDVIGHRLIHQFKVYNMGEITIPRKYGNGLDYKCNCTIYLPFAGTYNLNPRVVVGKTVKLKCVIDFVSGMVIYYLGNSNGDILHIWNGNCSMDMPITSSDYGEKLGNLAGAMITGGMTIAANSTYAYAFGVPTEQIGNYAKNAGMADISEMAQNVSMPSNVASTVPLTSSIGWTGPQNAYIQITTVDYNVNNSNYASTYGYPCDYTSSLSSLSGFTSAVCHVEIPGATADEKQMIERLLKSGVIL